MSMRTIIEINHDYLIDLIEDRSFMSDALQRLHSSDVAAALNEEVSPEIAPGVRVLAQRHHSEKLKLIVK